ncbi:MAG: hypothetical protein ACREUU_20115 [Gammaproteobacteria bacterium]
MNTTLRLPVTFAPVSDQTTWTQPIIAKAAVGGRGAQRTLDSTRRGSRATRVGRLTKSLPVNGNHSVLLPQRFAGRRFRVLNQLEPFSP